MKFDNIPDFISALKKRISELSGDEQITSATSVMSKFSEDELNKFDSIRDEATALFDTESEQIEFIYNRLLDLGYDDDVITTILDQEGF